LLWDTFCRDYRSMDTYDSLDVIPRELLCMIIEYDSSIFDTLCKSSKKYYDIVYSLVDPYKAFIKINPEIIRDKNCKGEVIEYLRESNILPNKKKHGICTTYYMMPDGNKQIKDKYTYKMDKKDGAFTEYNILGKVLREGEYKNSVLHGKVTINYTNRYDSNKNVIVSANANEREEINIADVDRIVFTNGYVRISEYVNGFKTGKEHIYYKDILSCQLTYKMNMLHGECMTYYDNGNIDKKWICINGVLDGEYIKLYKNGKMEQNRYYRKGDRQGEYRSFHENGNYKEHGIVGIKSGEWTDDGKLVELIYHNGTCYRYHKNGIPSCVYTQKDGKIEGIYRIFRDDGTLASEWEYFKNNRHGKCLEYDIYGNITRIKEFRDGYML
ncbi:MORN-repeat protein, partial [Orpheovirus IHUMI-LCC2]